MKSKFLTLVLSLALVFSAGLVMTGCDIGKTNTNAHKIVFMSDETQSATVLSTIYTAGNAEITLPTQADKTGYYTGGFVYYETVNVLNESGQVVLDGEGNPITTKNAIEVTKDTFKNKALDKDLTVYAKYLPKSYNVIYFVDGVQLDSQDPELAPVYYTVSDEAVELPTRIPPAGKVFDGWYFTSNYQQKINAIPANSTGQLVLYGRFVDE